MTGQGLTTQQVKQAFQRTRRYSHDSGCDFEHWLGRERDAAKLEILQAARDLLRASYEAYELESGLEAINALFRMEDRLTVRAGFTGAVS